jgi:hypothetical protein
MRRVANTTPRAVVLSALAAAVASAVLAHREPSAAPSPPAPDAGASADPGFPAIREAAQEFVHACWFAHGINPDLLDRCYAPEGHFRAVVVDAHGETEIPRAQWLAQLGARGGKPGPEEVIDFEPVWTNLDVQPGKVAGQVRVSFFQSRRRGLRLEGIWRQQLLGSGAPGPSPAIVEERIEVRPPAQAGLVARLPVKTEPVCLAGVDLRAGTYLVVTGAHDTFAAALAAARAARRRGRAAEIVPGRWLSPAEETFVLAAAAFADRGRAQRRAAEIGGRVLEVAAVGPGGAVPAWGMAAAGRIDGLDALGGPIDIRGDRVVAWGPIDSTVWHLGADAMTVERLVSRPSGSPTPEWIDPLTERQVAPPVGPRLPGLGAALPGGAALTFDEARDELRAPQWTLALGARDRLVQIFPRRDGLYLRFDDSLFLLRQAGADAGPHLGKLCGTMNRPYKPRWRTGTLVIATADAPPLRLDTDGTFELWAPVPSMVAPAADLTTFRCHRGETPTSQPPAADLLTELGLRIDVDVSCE